MNYENRLSDRDVAIFLFHGVIYPHEYTVRNYTRKHLDIDYFSDVLRRLRACGTPVSMDEIRLHYEEGRSLPPKSFAVTFDDGFENNLTVAAPVMVDLGIPATFYISTGLVDSNMMAWIDRIEYAIEVRREGELKLPWGVRVFSGEESCKRLLNEIRAQVKGSAAIDANNLADEVQAQLDVPITKSNGHPLDRKLSWDQVGMLAGEKTFIVAGHSHTHRILEHLSDADLAWEIDTSLKLLDDKVGLRSVHYSYPEGLSHCYSDRVIAVLKSRGIRCCPTAEDGVNGSREDLFHLKRIMVT